jgi:predicted neuraminidase
MSSILITEASSTEYTYDEKLLELSVFSTIVGEVELEKHLYAGSDLPEKAGWLYKKTSNPITRWNKRYFVLKDKVLKYYHKQDEISPSGALNLDQISIDVQVKRVKNGAEMHIFPHGSKVRFRLKASDTETLLEWATVLYQHIQVSKGFKHELTPASSDANFFRFQRISNTQFKRQACTGDLLLFRGKSFGSRFQRGLTRSKYDHVALLLRFQDSNLAILEATANDVSAM